MIVSCMTEILSGSVQARSRPDKIAGPDQTPPVGGPAQRRTADPVQA
jgi:hypothetical protein